jgi:hypothetical protein
MSQLLAMAMYLPVALECSLLTKGSPQLGRRDAPLFRETVRENHYVSPVEEVKHPIVNMAYCVKEGRHEEESSIEINSGAVTVQQRAGHPPSIRALPVALPGAS